MAASGKNRTASHKKILYPMDPTIRIYHAVLRLDRHSGGADLVSGRVEVLNLMSDILQQRRFFIQELTSLGARKLRSHDAMRAQDRFHIEFSKFNLHQQP